MKVLEYADEVSNISKVCRHFGISRESYYRGKKALRSYRKLIRAEAPRANLALKALLGKIEMHPKGEGRAVSYTARCNLKLGEILLPSVSSYGSGDRI